MNKTLIPYKLDFNVDPQIQKGLIIHQFYNSFYIHSFNGLSVGDKVYYSANIAQENVLICDITLEISNNKQRVFFKLLGLKTKRFYYGTYCCLESYRNN